MRETETRERAQTRQRLGSGPAARTIARPLEGPYPQGARPTMRFLADGPPPYS